MASTKICLSSGGGRRRCERQRPIVATLATAVVLCFVSIATLAGASVSDAQGASVVGHSAWPAWGHGATLGSNPDLDRPVVGHGEVPHVSGQSEQDDVSSNWSGLVDTGTTYTAISSYWTVPSVVPSEANEASGTWIGIDGAISGDDSIIQTGTAQTTSGGSTSYYAWYELYPNASVELGVVAPGDEMEAEIEEDSPGTWTITIEDLTSQQGSTGQVPYDGPGESAEWIEEVPSGDPQPGLADFGNADFTDLGVTTTEPDDVVSTPTFMANSDGDIIAYPGGFVDDDMTVTYGQPPTATAVAASPNPTASGTSVTYSASVSSAYGPPDGSVTFSAGSTSLCTASLSNGSGSCTSSAAPVGTDTVSGTYPGDPAFAASTGSTTLVVNSPAASAPPPSHGYWLVGSDGGIFTFGSALLYGSEAQRPAKTRRRYRSNQRRWWLLARRLRRWGLQLRRYRFLRLDPRPRPASRRVGPTEQPQCPDRGDGAI